MGRSAEVLELLVGEGALTLRDVQRRLGLGHSVAHRILQTWTALEYLSFNPETKVYRAGPKLMWVGAKVRTALNDPDLQARVTLVSDELGHTANVGILEGRVVVHVARSAVRQLLPFEVHAGSALPAHATAIGRVLLAHLPEARVRALYGEGAFAVYTENTIADLPTLLTDLAQVRRDGYAVALRMIETGIASAAVPLRDAEGRVVAALNAVGPTASFAPAEVRDRILPVLHRIAAAPIDLPPIFGGHRRREALGA
ncbi:MAG TPA: IclR family transcriptional regulator [Candidatus Sulfotelmatobacter sp.]|nr:IclR family transcriptional regulator [Candidatus Sulfotelmatobacter sp.]